MAHLVIGEEVPVPALPTNVWRFEVSQMSGDANAYNHESFDIKDEAEATAFAVLLDCIRKTQAYGYGKTTKEVEAQLLANIPHDVLTTALDDCDLRDLISDICGYDVTCEGYLASLDSFKIFWFDADGIQYYVKHVD